MEVLVILVPAALMGHVSAQMDIQELAVKLVSNNLISKKFLLESYIRDHVLDLEQVIFKSLSSFEINQVYNAFHISVT